LTNKTHALPQPAEIEEEAPRSGLNLNDILFAVFKHKGKIIIGSIIGLVAAAIVYVYFPTSYQSEAKLLVRYVLDRSPVDPIDGASAQSSVSSGFGRTSDKVIGSEAEILTSWDLAVQVAEAIGPKRLVPEMGDAASVPAAAGTVAAGVNNTAYAVSSAVLPVRKFKQGTYNLGLNWQITPSAMVYFATRRGYRAGRKSDRQIPRAFAARGRLGGP